MPDFYLMTFISVGVFFITLIGLHVRTIARVSKLETEVLNLTKQMGRFEDDLIRQRSERENDNIQLWREIASMKETLTKVVTLLESNNNYMLQTIKRHESLFEKLEKKLD